MAQSLMYGTVRGGSGEGTSQPLTINELKEQIVTGGLPPFTEMSRKFGGWTVQTATAFAPVAAVPTTTARLELFNNTVGQGAQVLVVNDLFAFQLLSTAATQTYAIWAMVTTQKAAPTNTALDMASMSGRNKWTTTAASPILSAVDTTVVANGWRPFGPVQAWGTAAATPGNSLVAEVHGKLIVPPGASLCIHVAGSIATASSFQCGASFYVVPITAPLL